MLQSPALAQAAQPAHKLGFRRGLVTTPRATDQVAVAGQRAAGASSLAFRWVKLVATERTFHSATLKAVSSHLSKPPTAKAKGKMKTLIANAVFQPRSLSVTEN